MRSGQFNNRKPRNAVGAGKRSSGNEFNTALKRERHPEPPQYPTSEVDERKQFSETRDARPKRSESSARGSSSDSGSSRSRSSSGKSAKASRGGNRMQNMTQGFVRQAAGMMVGAVIVTSSYQTMVEQRELREQNAQETAAFFESIEQYGEVIPEWLVEEYWTWSDDFTSATLSLPGMDGVEAVISEEIEEPTCTEEGTTTYTASATVRDRLFTGTRTEVSAEPTGHSFAEPETEGGRTVYHCRDCDETFEIGYGITKEE